MKVKFDFNLQAWIQDVEIEADSIEEAFETAKKVLSQENFNLNKSYFEDKYYALLRQKVEKLW